MKLDECIAEVMAQELPGDEEVQAALLKVVKACNYIPPPVEAEYALVLLEEYRKASRKKPKERTTP